MSSEIYLFAGASSKIAKETARILKQNEHTVIGISTKNENYEYDQFYTIEKYEHSYFPEIAEPIKGLIYFPGTINLKPFPRLTQNDFIRDYQINCLGAVAFTQKYLPNIKSNGGGSIIFISTVAVAIGMPFHSSIAMAKGAVEALTKSLAAELAPSIRVNCIAPSLTNTPLEKNLLIHQKNWRRLKIAIR